MISFRFYYDDRESSERRNWEEAFRVELQSVRSNPKEFNQECDLAAQEVALRYGASDLLIPLSGGIDSETVARIFLRNQIPFTPVIVRFSDGLNRHDISQAFEFVKYESLSPTIIEIDIEAFFSSGEYLRYLEAYHCGSPQICFHLWILDQLPGTWILPGQIPVIFCQDEIRATLLAKRELDQEYLIYEDYTNNPLLSYYQYKSGAELNAYIHEPVLAFSKDCQDPSYIRYFQRTGRSGVPQFFLSRPELMLSFLESRPYKCLLEANSSFTYSFKHQVCSLIDPSLRPRVKQTGFELLKKKLKGSGLGFDPLYRNKFKVEKKGSHDFVWSPLDRALDQLRFNL